MLHDPGSYSPPQRFTEISLAPAEKEVLRRLGGEIAAVAALPVHREKAGLWRKLNDLESARPMVWINEIPWHEMNVDDELTLRTVHPWARELETRLRRTLYQWRHMPCDMIVSDFLECPLAVHSTDFGIHEEVEVARTDASSDIVSRHFRVQIREPADIEKIRMPRVSHDQRDHRGGLRGDGGPVPGHHARAEGRPDPHLVHPVGLPHPVVGARGGDGRPRRETRDGQRGGGAHGGRLDGGAGPVRGAEPALPGLQQHPHRLRRLRLHVGASRARPTTPPG